MKKEPNKKRIAMFMILGLLFVSGIILKSVADKFYTEKTNLAVMYFNESIKGLSIGSPVVFKGVQVGKVVDIKIMTNPETLEFDIPVYVRFAKDGDVSSLSFYKEMNRKDLWQELINKGLRAKLISQNLLTGQLIIELQMLPDTPIELKNTADDKTLEIPTALSTVAGLSKDLQDLPIKKIVTRLDNILKDLEQQLPEILPRFAEFSKKLNVYADKSVPATNQTLNQLNATLKDISGAAKSIKNLTDYLERHPDSILKGKKE
ncbi:MAG: MCE family protein [Alphaproteobacteria bacterium]|nr:MCE family protein [Alphaproteobacteria bacterium]